jgi:hypothetical protein
MRKQSGFDMPCQWAWVPELQNNQNRARLRIPLASGFGADFVASRRGRIHRTHYFDLESSADFLRAFLALARFSDAAEARQ